MNFSGRKKIVFALIAGLIGFTAFCFSGTNEQAPEQVLGEVTQTIDTSICHIKGDINSRGEKIYYLPSCTYYNRIVVDQLVGETWFCDEREALEAGFVLSPSC